MNTRNAKDIVQLEKYSLKNDRKLHELKFKAYLLQLRLESRQLKGAKGSKLDINCMFIHCYYISYEI